MFLKCHCLYITAFIFIILDENLQGSHLRCIIQLLKKDGTFRFQLGRSIEFIIIIVSINIFGKRHELCEYKKGARILCIMIKDVIFVVVMFYVDAQNDVKINLEREIVTAKIFFMNFELFPFSGSILLVQVFKIVPEIGR